MEETKFRRPEIHLNQWVGIGRLCQDVELTHTTNGVPFAWVEVWVNTEQPGKAGQMGAVKEQFIKAQRWNPSEAWLKWAKRNRKVWVLGRLEGYRKDGQIVMQLNIDRIEFLDTPGSIQNGPVSEPEAEGQLAEQIKRLEQQNERLQDFNSEIRAKMEELTRANHEWEFEYKKLNEAYQELRTEQHQAVKAAPAPQKRATTAPAAKGKGRR
jgi:single-stranded DNA-binding protein